MRLVKFEGEKNWGNIFGSQNRSQGNSTNTAARPARRCCLKDKCSIQMSHLTLRGMAVLRPVSPPPPQPAETQDAESAFGSDSSSVLEWKPAEPVNVAKTPVPTTKKPLTALRVQVRQIFFCFMLRCFWGRFFLQRQHGGDKERQLVSLLFRRRTRTAAPTWAT